MDQTSKYRSALMGFAALWIYYFHVVPAIPLGLPLLNHLSCYVKDHGFCGVDIFLLLSGFGLVSSFQKKPVDSPKAYLRYVVRRLRRIWIVIVPVAIVIGLVDHWSILQFLGRCTGIWQLAVNIYDFLWFVPCILLFYLLAPLYYNLYRKTQHCTASACVIMAGWIMLIFVVRDLIRSDFYPILTRVPIFLLGICFGELRRRGFVFCRRHYLVAAAFMAAGLIYSYALSVAGPSWWFMPGLSSLVNLFIAPGIVLLGSRLCGWAEHLYWKPLRNLLLLFRKILVFFGTLSLEFYAVQEWIWLKMQNYAPLLHLFGSSMVLQQAATFVCCTLAALMVHQLAKLIPYGKKMVSNGSNGSK